MTDGDLIDRAQCGDDMAFENLVRPCLDVAFRTAFLITRDAADAEDATQTALIKAHAALGQFRRNEPFRPWLLRIVANEAKNTVRSRVRRRSDPWSDATAETVPSTELDPGAGFEARERSAWLVGHINALEPADRFVIYARYALDLSEAEMSAVLDCPRGTVKSRLHRALARLRVRIPANSPKETIP